jgi:chemotaxis protein histidine kinase CheA
MPSGQSHDQEAMSTKRESGSGSGGNKRSQRSSTNGGKRSSGKKRVSPAAVVDGEKSLLDMDLAGVTDLNELRQQVENNVIHLEENTEDGTTIEEIVETRNGGGGETPNETKPSAKLLAFRKRKEQEEAEEEDQDEDQENDSAVTGTAPTATAESSSSSSSSEAEESGGEEEAEPVQKAAPVEEVQLPQKQKSRKRMEQRETVVEKVVDEEEKVEEEEEDGVEEEKTTAPKLRKRKRPQTEEQEDGGDEDEQPAPKKAAAKKSAKGAKPKKEKKKESLPKAIMLNKTDHPDLYKVGPADIDFNLNVHEITVKLIRKRFAPPHPLRQLIDYIERHNVSETFLKISESTFKKRFGSEKSLGDMFGRARNYLSQLNAIYRDTKSSGNDVSKLLFNGAPKEAEEPYLMFDFCNFFEVFRVMLPNLFTAYMYLETNVSYMYNLLAKSIKRSSPIAADR